MTMKCELCDYQNDNLKRFSDHVRSAHEMNSEQYTIQIYHGGLKPTCKICNAPVRYVSYSFKTYCKEHAKVAMKEGGAIGGKSEAWNKGKTKETDERIRELSVRFSGVNNPFYGKKHSDVTKLKNAAAHRLQFAEVLRRINEANPTVKVLSDWRSYVTQDSLLNLQCSICNNPR